MTFECGELQNLPSLGPVSEHCQSLRVWARFRGLPLTVCDWSQFPSLRFHRLLLVNLLLLHISSRFLGCSLAEADRVEIDSRLEMLCESRDSVSKSLEMIMFNCDSKLPRSL
jgi:hypothetical protein